MLPEAKFYTRQSRYTTAGYSAYVYVLPNAYAPTLLKSGRRVDNGIF